VAGKLSRVTRVDELAGLVGWTGTASAELSWQDVAEQLGLQVPAAYHELLEVFPSGEFADGIRVISPVQDTGTLDLDGLILWATDDDHCYFRDPSGGRDADTRPVVFLENTGPSSGTYKGSVVDFLFDVITGNLKHDALYSDWEDAPKTFHPTRFMSD
jgi:hypothetical protein